MGPNARVLRLPHVPRSAPRRHHRADRGLCRFHIASPSGGMRCPPYTRDGPEASVRRLQGKSTVTRGLTLGGLGCLRQTRACPYSPAEAVSWRNDRFSWAEDWPPLPSAGQHQPDLGCCRELLGRSRPGMLTAQLVCDRLQGRLAPCAEPCGVAAQPIRNLLNGL